MRRNPIRSQMGKASSNKGRAMPLYAQQAQPVGYHSCKNRATFAILALASGSLLPRPTSNSSVSSGRTKFEEPNSKNSLVPGFLEFGSWFLELGTWLRASKYRIRES